MVVTRAKRHKTAKLCLEFPTVGWKKTFPNTLLVKTHSHFSAFRPRCHGTHTQTPQHWESAVLTEHAWSVPAEWGVQITHTFHSLSSEISLEMEVIDSVTHKRHSMGMNTVIYHVLLKGKRGEMDNEGALVSSTARNYQKAQTDPDPFPSRIPRAKVATNTPKRRPGSFVQRCTISYRLRADPSVCC